MTATTDTREGTHTSAAGVLLDSMMETQRKRPRSMEEIMEEAAHRATERIVSNNAKRLVRQRWRIARELGYASEWPIDGYVRAADLVPLCEAKLNLARENGTKTGGTIDILFFRGMRAALNVIYAEEAGLIPATPVEPYPEEARALDDWRKSLGWPAKEQA